MNAPLTDGSNPPTPAHLQIIRLAMLLGGLFFGGIVWYLIREGALQPTPDEELALLLRYLFYGLLVAVLVGLVALRRLADRPESAGKRGTLLLAGYGIAEGLMLFGVVYLLLTGNATLFLGGLAIFLLSFLILPLEPPA